MVGSKKQIQRADFFPKWVTGALGWNMRGDVWIKSPFCFNSIKGSGWSSARACCFP